MIISLTQFLAGVSCLALIGCGGSAAIERAAEGGSPGFATFTNPANFTATEMLNPLDSVFGTVTSRFNALNGAPLVDTDSMNSSVDFIGQMALREGGTGTLFSGTMRMTIDFNSDSGFGRMEAASVSHDPTDSRFIDGTLPILITTVENGIYEGQISGTFSERAFSPRVGLSYDVSGTVQGAVVTAPVNGLTGTRTFGNVNGQIERSTGETNTATGIFAANF